LATDARTCQLPPDIEQLLFLGGIDDPADATGKQFRNGDDLAAGILSHRECRHFEGAALIGSRDRLALAPGLRVRRARPCGEHGYIDPQGPQNAPLAGASDRCGDGYLCGRLTPDPPLIGFAWNGFGTIPDNLLGRVVLRSGVGLHDTVSAR